LNTVDAPVAVAVYGSDVGLESTQTILLETNAILLLFSPSLTFLQVLKSAIGTVIDLPEIKLKDNVPFIVYKYISFLGYYSKVHANFTLTRMRGIDRFHVVPGFAISKSEQQSTESCQSSSLELSVKLIQKCTTHASDPIVLHKLANEDTLIPPWGTVWWKK
jgi:hypothetical protein